MRGRAVLRTAAQRADPRGMTSTVPGLAADLTPGTDEHTAPVFDLLPPRAVVLDRLAEELPRVPARPATLVLVGLRRRDDGWPIPPEALTRITSALATQLRADDWLARSGPTEFAVLVPGPVPAARAVADRVVGAIGAEAVGEIAACAGIAALAEGVTAAEVLRRATLCLATARTIGPGQLVTYSGTR
jgi:GGDEF domain-containing protein